MASKPVQKIVAMACDACGDSAEISNPPRERATDLRYGKFGECLGWSSACGREGAVGVGKRKKPPKKKY